MAHLALTATALIALAFHAPLWAADLLLTSCFNDDELIMAATAAGGAGCSTGTAAYALLVIVLLSGAATFFVAVLRLHLALSPPKGLAAARKGTVATVTAAALAVLGLCVVLLQF